MRIFLNNQEVDLLKEETLKEILIRQNIACEAIAIAVNNKVVSKDAWEATLLQDGDKITIIRASCGG